MRSEWLKWKAWTWDNKKSLMESHNKQLRRVNWTPERITQGEEGSATLETHAVHANKLEAEFKFNIWLTTVHQHVRSKKSTEKCWSVGRKKPSPQVVRLFEPHPGLLAGCCTIETQPSQSTLPWCSSHSKLANKTPQRFFTLEVQLTASKGTTTHSQPRLSLILNEQI